MAITQISSLDQTVVASYESDYLIWAEKAAVWAQVVNYIPPVAQDGGGGSSFDWPVFHQLAPATTALTETDNITPVALSDSNVTLTPTEYGNAVQLTQKLRFQSRADVRQASAKILGENQAKTVDALIRNAVLGGSWSMYGGSANARTDLDTTSDLVTHLFLEQLVAQARGAQIPPYDGHFYLSIVNPMVAVELRALNEFKNPAYYQNQMVGGLLRGEIGELAGIRFIEHEYGKLYLSGGTTAQAATDLDGSVAAGATAIKVTTSNGLAAGSYITIGTLEDAGADPAEMVKVTTQSGVSCTIQGIGNTFGNFGLAYSHADAAAVTEAFNAAAIPIIGRETVRGVYGQGHGKYGQVVITAGADTGDWLDRFLGLGWKWYGGFGLLEKYSIRGEVAVRGNVIGKVSNY